MPRAHPNSTPLLSAAIIARNEHANLAHCLRSLHGLVDEIIVVDTGSTDDTVAIARSFEARVIEEPWRNDFAFHRNTALSHCAGDWILVVDCDERVVETDLRDLRARLAAEGLPRVLLASLLLRYPGGTTATFYAPRLIRRSPDLRYIFPVHEQLDVVEEVALLSSLVMEHSGYADEATLLSKERRNLAIAETMADSPHKDHCIARASFTLKKWDRVILQARRLVAGEGSLILKQEACVLGGASAVSIQQGTALAEFVSAGLAIAPQSVDLLFLQAVQVLIRYGNAIDHAERSLGSLMRPPLLTHDRAKAMRVLRELLSHARRGQPLETDPGPEETR